MERVQFINPAREFSRDNMWKLVHSVTPPLGLASLSAVLEKHGIGSSIIDAGAEELNDEGILQKISPVAEIIGFSATTPEIINVCQLAEKIREKFPNKKILMGGVHPTVFHRELVEMGICDFVIRGEGENAVLKLLSDEPLANIPNLTWRVDSGEIKENPPAKDYLDMEMLPFPAYEKLPMSKYKSALGAARQEPSIGIITSRGCPGTCTFCYSGMFGRKIRADSAEKVLEHVFFLQKDYGIREASFYDDTFTWDQNRVNKICEGLIKRNRRLSWSCFARVDSVSPDLLRTMKMAGCHQIMYGFESSNEAVLKTINKRTDLGKALQVVDWTRKAEIDVRGAFMLGSPGENRESLEKTIDFACNLDIQFAIFNITTPFPGTEMFRAAKEKDILTESDWRKFDLSHSVMELAELLPKEVEELYGKAFRRFYLRPYFMFQKLMEKRSYFQSKNYRKLLFLIFRALMGKLPFFSGPEKKM